MLSESDHDKPDVLLESASEEHAELAVGSLEVPDVGKKVKARKRYKRRVTSLKRAHIYA